MPFTQRPDRFCAGLLEGRVGLLCDGLPFGYLLPGTMDQFFRTSQDRAYQLDDCLYAAPAALFLYGWPPCLSPGSISPW